MCTHWHCVDCTCSSVVHTHGVLVNISIAWIGSAVVLTHKVCAYQSITRITFGAVHTYDARVHTVFQFAWIVSAVVHTVYS